MFAHEEASPNIKISVTGIHIRSFWCYSGWHLDQSWSYMLSQNAGIAKGVGRLSW